MQVHDELVLEVPHELIDDVRDRVIVEMEGAYPLEVPLVVSTAVGDNWEAAH
ncbi:MAG TPA: hypothetical protein DIU15_01535, partial [Deltaproteobacteria bacterium]|nr:hypothetical protein [Deltaproteobacteria bacterium]